MACFAAVSGVAVPATGAALGGAAVAVSVILTAAPAHAEAVVWDANWGAADAPTTIPDANVITSLPNGTVLLSRQDSPFVEDGQTVVRLSSTAEGATDVIVVGGAGATGTGTGEGALTADTWLKVTGGTYDLIVGGSDARNYGGGPASDFTGDTHILLTADGASTPTADYIIGANYQDGQNAAFTGNTYISVQSGSVTGSIVGGGTAAHFMQLPFTGDSHVWVYTPLVSTADPLFSLPNNAIIGGCATIANDGGNLQHAGSSGVSVDFSAYTPVAGYPAPDMDKIIVGGAWLHDQTTLNHTAGNSGVSISGTMADGSNALFPQVVVGGSYFVYDGSGSGTGTGSATHAGNVSVALNGGSFRNAVVGGSYIASAGGTSSSSIAGTTTLTLGGNTVVDGADALVVGGSYVNANAANVQSGAIGITINGGSYAADVVGGSYITAAGTGVVTQTTGDISLTLAGGTLSGTLYGGSYSARNTASTNAHGAVTVALKGGSVQGDVYAAGGLSADSLASSVTAASTQVELSGAVTLGAEGAPVTISGGVQNANAASTVTGARSLVLADAAYNNLANAIFTDFTVVNNASAATLNMKATDAALTKQGAGTLTLAESSNLDSLRSLTVEQGVLSTGALTAGGAGLDAVTVAGGASLQAAALTLADNALLTLDVTNAATAAPLAVVGDLTVDSGDTLQLTLTGVDALTEGDSRTLMSWGNADNPFELSQLDWTNRGADESLVLSFVGKSLVLADLADNEWVWDGASGTWDTTSTNWQGAGSTQGGATPDAKDVSFMTPTVADATVSINGTVTPAGVTVDNAEGTSYTFEQAGTGTGISGQDTMLFKDGDGTLVMNLANAYAGGTVVDGGTLEAAVQGALGSGEVTLTSGELLVSEETAVQGNALEFNGGELRYAAGETRDLDTAAITHTLGERPMVEVAAGTTVTWQYTAADALEDALDDGMILSGGGTLVLEAQDAASAAALGGAFALVDAGTQLQLGATGSRLLGTDDAPMAIGLGEGTTLLVERPQADGSSVITSELSGTGTLQFDNSVAAANSTVLLSGDNSAFEGDINLGTVGTAPAVADSAAVIIDASVGDPLGGTLNLNGLGFAMLSDEAVATTAADIVLAADTTQYAEVPGLTTSFSGDISSDVGLTWTLDATGAAGDQQNTLTGDVSGFEGTLATKGAEGRIARWELGSSPADTTPVIISADLLANDAYNEFIFSYAGDTDFEGAAMGNANVTQRGSGLLTLLGDNTSSGTFTVEAGCEAQIGDEFDAGQWGSANGSTLAGAGTLTLAHGAFVGPVAVGNVAPTIDVDVDDGLSFDMAGNAGSLITGTVTLGEGSTLTQVGGDILDRELDFTLAVDNVGTAAAPGDVMVQFVENTVVRASDLRLGSETEDITIDASTEAVINLLREHRVAEVDSYLTLTNGQLVTAADFSNVSFSGSLNLLRDLGLRLTGVDGGSLVLSGLVEGVYIAGEDDDPTAVAGYQNFGAYQAVAVMPDSSLILTLPGAPDPDVDGEGAVINNLLGGKGSELIVNNTVPEGEVAVVILNNEEQLVDPEPGDLPGDPSGPDTVFEGEISDVGGDVEFIKSGAGSLTVGGAVAVYQLTAEEGTITLNGRFNALENLSLEGGEVQFGNGASAVETLVDDVDGGSLSIAPKAVVVVTGTSLLEDARVGGTDEGAGFLLLRGDLTLAEDARLDGVALGVRDGTLVLDETTGHKVSALYGIGTVQGVGSASTVGLEVTGTRGIFTGTLAGNGTLTVAAGAQQGFAPAFTSSAGWDLVNNGTMSLNFVRADGTNAPLTLGALRLGANSVTNLSLNTSAPMEGLLTLGTIAAGQGAAVNLTGPQGGDIVRQDASYVIGTEADGQPAGVIATLTPDRNNTAYMLLDAERSNLSVDGAGNIVLNLVTTQRNSLAPQADNANSAAAAGMLWNAAYSGHATTGTDIRRVLDALNSGMSRGEVNRALAAVSGASTTVLSSALAADVERQLRAIRNRTTLLGAAPCNRSKGGAGADEPRIGVWVNGEGDHRKMDAGGYMPGYSLSSWGGTLGMDTAVGDGVSAGLALTALYGDLKAHSADHADGDFNRYYVTAFGRLDRNRWQHTLLGTVGRLDADLDRRVDFGAGSYATRGSTDGWGYGLMYEIGYTLPQEEGSLFTLQPVVNVAWRHIDVDGYTERGSDAALRVGDQDYDVVTFGAGFRTQAELGERLFNRRALFEARALVKVDAGDRKGEAAVAMLGGGGDRERVRSEKLGAVGVELGAGFTFPVGSEGGAFFIDGTAELRNSYSNLNGTVGYRFEF